MGSSFAKAQDDAAKPLALRRRSLYPAAMPACAACGTAAPLPFRAPPAETAPDLDGRPGEPTRSTLRRWLLRCRGCGACAPDLATLPPGAADIVRSPGYRAQPPFLRWAALAAGTPDEAQALLQAAWEAEDSGADAMELRRRAAALWPAPADAEAALRLADIQRRAGLLAEAAATLDSWPDRDDASARIAVFERARIAVGDTGRHLLSSALRPPARTPHVTHGKRAAGGFWGRLLGGAS